MDCMTFDPVFKVRFRPGILPPMETRAAASPVAGASLAARTPAHLFFMVSAVFHYLGPAFAVLLFAQIAPLGVAWLRIASAAAVFALWRDRKSTRLNSSHSQISYAVFCLKKKKSSVRARNPSSA